METLKNPYFPFDIDAFQLIDVAVHLKNKIQKKQPSPANSSAKSVFFHKNTLQVRLVGFICGLSKVC